MSHRYLNAILAACCCGLLAIALGAGQAGALAAPDTDTGRPDTIELRTAPGTGEAALNAIGDGYLSPVRRAPRPFTHLLLRWEADLPPEATLELQVRASRDGIIWTDWGEAHENHDLWMPADGDTVFWSEELYAGEDMLFWQVRATLAPAPDGAMPILRTIEINTVDARFGPRNPRPDAASPASLARPPVVSRSAWGSPDGQGSRVQPVYYPVKHMTVHHTADSNSLSPGQNWADRVRAIWAFHTYTRAWGDIGYNYLIDPAGVIYEGRAGGDDAVGFHDTANYGSMGVAMIGTYSNNGLNSPASAGLVDLLAWKAAQKGIDPLGRSFYYGCSISPYCRPYNAGAIVENIAGHRQVTPGRTTCPGDALLENLPQIRNQVAQRLQGGTAGVPDNGDLQIDELESSFTRSEANWYQAACGYGGNTFYTYATDRQAESSNRATWNPDFPSAGSYRIFAHIPQGCALASPPYATRQANYRISHAGGETVVSIDQNTAEQWVDLGLYDFNAGRSGDVRLDDLTGEPYSQRKVVFFDSLRFVPEQREQVQLELLAVEYDRTALSAGELLGVRFTVRNSGDVAVLGQDPQAGTRPDGSFDNTNSYVYDEGECFLGGSAQDYPAFAKETGRFRVTLGITGTNRRATACSGDDGGYPWRWGLNGSLEPGETRVITGYLRFREPGTVTLQAGLIEEYVRYHARDIAPTTITISAEKLAPEPAAYDAALQPLARVYRLGNLPDNLLARTRSPLSVVKGDYLGSFAWDGSLQNWGEGGPLVTNTLRSGATTISQTERFTEAFIIEQTRVFIAPLDGEYTFEITSDDGAWLWINGHELLNNYGLHDAATISGTIRLARGRHVLAFKYFERSGAAVAGYAVRMPGTCVFSPLIDGLVGAAPAGVDPRLGAVFQTMNGLTIVADDQGGSGVIALRYSWDGQFWIEEAGAVLTVGRFVEGDYTLYYEALDQAGNRSPVTELRFSVDPGLLPYRTFFPVTLGTGSDRCAPSP